MAHDNINPFNFLAADPSISSKDERNMERVGGVCLDKGLEEHFLKAAGVKIMSTQT